jgi:hypothetical protein
MSTGDACRLSTLITLPVLLSIWPNSRTFGGAWAETDRFLCVVDNGPSIDRLVRIVEGRDHLWDGDDEDMFNFAIYNWIPSAAPVLSFTEGIPILGK